MSINGHLIIYVGVVQQVHTADIFKM